MASQRAAQLQGLGHLDGGHALTGGARHRLQEHGHAHRLTAKLIVVKGHQGRIRALIGQLAAPVRQVLKTGHHLARETADPVINPAAVVGLKGLQRRIAELGMQLGRAQLAAADFKQLADGLGRRQQGTVIGGIGRPQGLAVEADGVEGDQKYDRQQDAQHQLPAQRAAAQRAEPHVCAFSK